MTDILAVLRADTSEFSGKLAEAKAEVKDLSDSGSSNFSKLASVGKAASLAVAAGVVAAGAASVDLAMKYQSTTASIAANAGISMAAAQKIGTAFLSTAGTTEFSGQQIATAYAGVAGQLGTMEHHALNAKQALAIMKTSMDLAEGSGENLNNATTDLVQTMQAFGIGLGGATNASNILFSTARALGTNVDAVSKSFTTLRGQLGAASPSLSQLGGLMVDLAQHGEANSRAMRSVTTSLAGLLTPTAAVQAAQQQMGVSFENAKGQMLPFQDIIGELQPKLAGMGNQQATATLKSLGFGAAAGKLVSTIQAGPAAFDAATRAVQKHNAAADAAAKQQQTLSHQFETVKATVQDYGVKIGQALLPKIEDLVKIGTKVVAFLTKHKEVAIALAVVVGGVLTTAFAAWAVSLVMVDGALSPIVVPMLAVIAVAAALAAGAYEIISHWSAISAFFKRVWQDIKNWFDDGVRFIEDHLGTIAPIIATLLLGPIGGIVALIATHWNTVKNDTVRIWDDIVSFVTGIPSKILDGLKDLGGKLYTLAHDAFERVKTAFTDAWDDVKSWLTGLWSKITSAIGDLAGDYYNWCHTAFERVKQAFIDAWSDVASWLSGLWSRITSAVGDLATDFYNFGKNVLTGFGNGIYAIWVHISSWFSGLAGVVGGLFTGAVHWLEGAGNAIIQGLWNGMTAIWSKVTGWISGLAGDIANLKGPLDYDATLLVPHGNAIMQSLHDGLVQGYTGKVAPFLKSIAGQIASTSFTGPNSSITPIAGLGGGATSGAGAGTQPIYFQVDGQTFAQVILPSFQTVGLRNQRFQSLPILGTTQSA